MSDITQFMTPDPKITGPDLTLVEACRKMREGRSSYLVVVEGNRPIGIITEADITRRAIPDGLDLKATRVRQSMSKPVATIAHTSSMEDANTLMKTRGFRHLVVMEGDRMVGMVTLLGLLRYFEQRSSK